MMESRPRREAASGARRALPLGAALAALALLLAAAAAPAARAQDAPPEGPPKAQQVPPDRFIATLAEAPDGERTCRDVAFGTSGLRLRAATCARLDSSLFNEAWASPAVGWSERWHAATSGTTDGAALFNPEQLPSSYSAYCSPEADGTMELVISYFFESNACADVSGGVRETPAPVVQRIALNDVGSVTTGGAEDGQDVEEKYLIWSNCTLLPVGEFFVRLVASCQVPVNAETDQPNPPRFARVTQARLEERIVAPQQSTARGLQGVGAVQQTCSDLFEVGRAERVAEAVVAAENNGRCTRLPEIELQRNFEREWVSLYARINCNNGNQQPGQVRLYTDSDCSGRAISSADRFLPACLASTYQLGGGGDDGGLGEVDLVFTCQAPPPGVAVQGTPPMVAQMAAREFGSTPLPARRRLSLDDACVNTFQLPPFSLPVDEGNGLRVSSRDGDCIALPQRSFSATSAYSWLFPILESGSNGDIDTGAVRSARQSCAGADLSQISVTEPVTTTGFFGSTSMELFYSNDCSGEPVISREYNLEGVVVMQAEGPTLQPSPAPASKRQLVLFSCSEVVPQASELAIGFVPACIATQDVSSGQEPPVSQEETALQQVPQVPVDRFDFVPQPVLRVRAVNLTAVIKAGGEVTCASLAQAQRVQGLGESVVPSTAYADRQPLLLRTCSALQPWSRNLGAVYATGMCDADTLKLQPRSFTAFADSNCGQALTLELDDTVVGDGCLMYNLEAFEKDNPLVRGMRLLVECDYGFPVQPPTFAPIPLPTRAPSATPTRAPSATPIATPTRAPIATPTRAPTASPSSGPSASPSVSPSRAPTAFGETLGPSASPTLRPTASPSALTSLEETTAPSASPSTTGAGGDPSQDGSGTGGGGSGGNDTTTEYFDPNGDPTAGILIAVMPVLLIVAFVVYILLSKRRGADDDELDEENPAALAERLPPGSKVDRKAGLSMMGYSMSLMRVQTKGGSGSGSGGSGGGGGGDGDAPVVVDEFAIKLREVTLGPLIGKGGSARVYKGAFRGSPVAVKELLAARGARSFDRELRHLRTLQHPNLVRLYGAVDEAAPPHGQRRMLVTELAVSSLAAFIRAKGKAKPRLMGEELFAQGVTCATALQWLEQTCSGMTYLHSRKMLHLDIKPANLLLDKAFNVKISDLGSSRSAASVSTGSGPAATTLAGTAAYSAPELFALGDGGDGGAAAAVSSAADVYSFGIVAWQVLNLGETHPSKWRLLELVDQVAKGYRPPLEGTPPPLAALLRASWAASAEARPRFDQLLEELGRLLGQRSVAAAAAGQETRQGRRAPFERGQKVFVWDSVAFAAPEPVLLADNADAEGMLRLGKPSAPTLPAEGTLVPADNLLLAQPLLRDYGR